MKHPRILAAAAAFATLCPALALDKGWTNDWEAAKKQAAAEHKDLLLDFTGSDWCGWCIKLRKEVFSQPEFDAGVKSKFILVELDFPRDASKLSAATQEQNKKLSDQFHIQGYPTVLLCDASGKPFAQTGYQEGGAPAYVTHLDGLLDNKKKRDEGLAAAAKLDGPAKAKALAGALAALPKELVQGSYGDIVAQIQAADPKDESGFGKQLARDAKEQKFQQDLSAFFEKQDFPGAIAFVDKHLKEDQPAAEEKQQLLATRAAILANTGKLDEALRGIDDAIAAKPDSELVKNLNDFKKQLEEAKKKPAETTPATPEK